MGLWAWTIEQMLSPKFWKSIKKEGFVYTYIRGHRAVKHSQDIGGRHGLVKCVGQDQFGNKYYEDFDTDHRNQRRWVEYSDYFLSIGITGDRVPPGWHGWINHVYDDAPSEEGVFIKPFYTKEHSPITSGTPLHNKPPGAPSNLNRMEFIATTKARRSTSWQPPEGSDVKIEGKKLVVEKKTAFQDID